MALFGVPIPRRLSGYSRKPQAVAEANEITERGFYIFKFERVGVDLVPGRALQSDALVLLSWDKAPPELKTGAQSWSWSRRGESSMIVA